MNAKTEPREPMADEAGPKPDTKAPRRKRAAVTAASSTSATPAGDAAAAEAPASRARRAGKPAAGAHAKPRVRARATAAQPSPRPSQRPPEVPAADDTPAVPAGVPAEAPVEPVAVVAKARTVRETVKLTEGDRAALDHLSARADLLGRKARKSTLMRAAIRALAALDDAGLAAALDAPVPALLAVAGGKRRKAR